MQTAPNQAQWNSTLYSSLGSGLLLSGLVSYLLFLFEGVIPTLAAFLCLALGLWLTRGLASAFTGVTKANPASLIFLFTGKLLWWIGLFVMSKKVTAAQQWPVAIGFLFFMIAITLAGLVHYGFKPKSSESKLGDS